MVGLRRRDVDMLRRRFVVSQQVVEVGSEFRGFDQPKTQAGRRSVPIWAPIYPILEEQLATRASRQGRTGLREHPGQHATPIELHFPDVEEGTRANRASGSSLARLEAHLRRDSDRCRRGPEGDPRRVRALSYKTTMDVYGHLFESSSERAADAMEAMYRGSLSVTVECRLRMKR